MSNEHLMSMVDDMLDDLIRLQRESPMTIPDISALFVLVDAQQEYLSAMLATAIGRLA